MFLYVRTKQTLQFLRWWWNDKDGILTSLSFFWAVSLLSLSTRYKAAQVMSVPWPRSPNMTANRKGKVIMVYGAGDKEAGWYGTRCNRWGETMLRNIFHENVIMDDETTETTPRMIQVMTEVNVQYEFF